MTDRPPIRTTEWWAVVDEDGVVWHTEATRQGCMEWAVGTFDLSRRWRYMRESCGYSIRRVIVTEREEEG
jgi:hypothetical protein